MQFRENQRHEQRHSLAGYQITIAELKRGLTAAAVKKLEIHGLAEMFVGPIRRRRLPDSRTR
jgi:hypothetical protein